MSQDSYIPVPYFQFVSDAAKYDLVQTLYKEVPNKKIHRHYPFITIKREDINLPLMNVAVATEDSVSEQPAEKAFDLVNPATAEIPSEDSPIVSQDPLNQDIDTDKNSNVIVNNVLNANLLDNQDKEADKNTDQKNTTHHSDDEANSTKTTRPTPPASDSENLLSDTTIDKKQLPHSKPKHEEDDSDEELSEEEKLKIKKEKQLESYKQFLAEQKSKVKIDYPGIRIDIEANALPSRLYFIMNALSAIIASYGLVINSAAVVIGAMLVAMMLGPISGAALAIIDYRIPFLRKSLFTIVAGAAMVIFIGFMVGFMHQDTPLTNEILSRTEPTSMDLMIALAGGTAGAYAMISPHLSVAVVGVAVATALVPPLAASGILFAHGESSLGLGALLLALTNIIAIQFTNALVLWTAGFRRLVEDYYKSSPMITFFRRNAVPLLLLMVIGAYLTYNFNTINKKQKFESEVKESLNNYFIDKGNALTATQFVPREDHQTLRAVIRGETRPSSNETRYLEQKINQRINEYYPQYLPVRLQLRYIPVIVIESSPYHKDDIDKTDAAILTNEQPS